MDHGLRRDSRWCKQARMPGILLPSGLRDWLLDETSLTRRLQEVCTGAFRVQKLAQWRGRPLQSERHVLAMRNGECALIREVHLLCGDIPWVFARTVIPLRNLNGRRRVLARLGNKPLGAALFADRSLRRGEVEIAKILPGQYLFLAATGSAAAGPQAIWGRRSLFHMGAKPLLVSEIFLPAHGQCQR